MILSEFLADVYLPSRSIAAKTRQQYEITVRGFEAWAGKPVEVGELSADMVRRYVTMLRESGRAPKTCNNRRTTLLSIWRFAWEENLKSEPPPSNRRCPRVPEQKRIPRAWTLDETRKLLKAASEAPPLPRFSPTWFPKHWELLLRVLWETGLRVSALLDTRRSELDSRGFLWVAGEDQKHNGDGSYELKPETADELRSLPEHETLFPWPLSRRQLWVRYERDILGPAGLLRREGHAADFRSLKFQRMRKTSASHLAAAAGEYAAMMHLGHSSIETTRNSYLDPSIVSPQKSAARLLPNL